MVEKLRLSVGVWEILSRPLHGESMHLCEKIQKINFFMIQVPWKRRSERRRSVSHFTRKGPGVVSHGQTRN